MAETEQGEPLPENGVSSGEGTSPKKRGRPKDSTEIAGDMNGETAKQPRGEGESKDLESPPRKRGRPKGAPKKFIQKTETSEGAVQNTPKRGRPKKGQGQGKRGRPKKMIQARERQQESAADGTGLPRKSPGRPKGSRNKVLIVSLGNLTGRPKRVHVVPEKFTIALPRKNPGKRGRPKKRRRGRPRKEEEDEEEEEYRPKVRKTLGRPRKYPKENLPDKASCPETPRRGRGRPRKSESKMAHLKRFINNGSSESDKAPKDEKEQNSPRKRGRPKGSVKNKAIINNSSEKNSQNSDQSIEGAPEDAHEEGNASNSTPLKGNSLNSEDN